MTVLFQEIIRKKRDGAKLTEQEIGAFVDGITNNSATDAHIAAFAMAVFFQGLDAEETVALTLAMRDSGDVLDWAALQGPVADKHSTGGVGDNVSLMLAPMAAALGLNVPMISGRGLGHTGGTLDKMDSIPGYISQPDSALFTKVTEEVGCAIIGQTANLAVADKRFYGVRDVTATVENLSLITASILSKKLAAGLGWLVLDVKCGNGAFMQTRREASALAESLVRIANQAGTSTVALVTDMNQPLASAAGNAVEVVNAVEFLTGKHRDPRLEEVTVSLVAEMVAISHGRDDLEAVKDQVREKLENGDAAKKFDDMVLALGGPEDFCQSYKAHLPQAPITQIVTAPTSGFVSAVDTRNIGLIVVEMGGGRITPDDVVDPAVGLTDLLQIGASVNKGDRLCTVHAHNDAMAQNAARAIQRAYTISNEPPEIQPVIYDRLQ